MHFFMKKFLQKQMNSTSRIVILFSLLFSVISCNEDPNQLGLDLLPPSDDFTLLADSSTVITLSTVLQDTAVTHFLYYDQNYYSWYDSDSLNLLGDYTDNMLGNKKAEMLLRFLPPYFNADSFPVNAHADSLVLYLKIDSVWLGAKNTILDYQIYKVAQDIKSTDTIYSSTDLTPYKGALLGEGSFNLQSDSVRIVFNRDADNLRNTLVGLTTLKQLEDSAFMANVLKGFYITVQKEDATGAMASFNTEVALYSTTRLALYYNDSLTFNFYTRDYYNGAFTLKTDLTNSIVPTETENTFIHGLVGPITQLNFPSPYEIWKDSGLIAINKAEMVVTPALNSFSKYGITPGKYPKQLEVFYKSTNSSGKPIRYTVTVSTYKNGGYSFNLASYYQLLVRNRIKYSPLYIRDYNNIRSTGIFTIGKTDCTTLKIIYSKIN